MAAPETEAGQASAPKGPNHGLRIFLIWLPIAVAAVLVIWIVWSPHLPPGNMSDTAHSQQWTMTVLAVLAAPVMAFVLVFAGYALIVWRHREGDEDDGPPIHGHTGIQATWITVSAVIVLFLAGFGTFELASPGFAGAGAGEGPSAINERNGITLRWRQKTGEKIKRYKDKKEKDERNNKEREVGKKIKNKNTTKKAK